MKRHLFVAAFAVVFLSLGIARAVENKVETKEEQIQQIAAKAFISVKSALESGDEELAAAIIERALRLAWEEARLATLEEQDAEGREEGGAKADEKPAPPLRIRELTAAGRAYLERGEEDALERLVGREFVLTGTFRGAASGPGEEITATVRHESARRVAVPKSGATRYDPPVKEPAEILEVRVTSEDRAALERRVGSRVTVRGRLVKVAAKPARGKVAGAVRMTLEANAGTFSR